MIHVERDANLGDKAWIVPEVSQPFFLYGDQLIPQAITYSFQAKADCKNGWEIPSAQDTEDINIIPGIPLISQSDKTQLPVFVHQR